MKESSYFGRSLYKFRTFYLVVLYKFRSFYFGNFVVFLSKRGGGCVPLLLQRLWISLKSPRLAAILIEHRRRLIFSPLPSSLPRFPSILLKSEPRFCPNPSFQVLSKNFETDQPRPLRLGTAGRWKLLAQSSHILQRFVSIWFELWKRTALPFITFLAKRFRRSSFTSDHIWEFDKKSTKPNFSISSWLTFQLTRQKNGHPNCRKWITPCYRLFAVSFRCELAFYILEAFLFNFNSFP